MINKSYDFMVKNFKYIITAFAFIIGLYIQHIVNTQKINDLEVKYKEMNCKLDSQYQKFDAVKLDKAVFEATIKQLQSMSDDIREIRNDIREVLKDK